MEGAVPPDMLLKFTEEDLETLRRLLYFDKIACRSSPPNECLEVELFQAAETYENEEARLVQAFVDYFTSIADPANEEAGSGIEELCLWPWVDQRTKQICHEPVPTGKKSHALSLERKARCVW